MDQINEVATITQCINQSLNIDEGTEEKYTRLRHEGKEAAQHGDLERSLSLFRQAYDLRPSEKLQNRIQRLEEAIQEVNSSEEEEEFVDVQGSGLMLYKGLYDQLYQHQKEGVAFLYSLHRDGRGGGILADDMGLGKTVQMVSFLSAMYDAELTKHTLLVMPTSLIKNWLSEFKRWTPGLRVKEFHGINKSERSRNLERIQRGGGAIITTYQMLINNWQQLAAYEEREFVWDYIILDEAHKIKSSSTKTAKCVNAVPAHHRLLLTGTPVQNNLREMWALFDFACQGALLGSAKTFKSEYENPITRAREKDATPGEKALGLKISLSLTELIRPYFLRRTKAEVQNRKQMMLMAREQELQGEEKKAGAEIPSLTRKTDLIVWSFLSEVQEDIYRQFISLDHIKELLTTTRSPLAELTVLKKLCDHPRLLSVRAVTQLGLGEGPAELSENDNQSAANNIEGVADETLIAESGKLKFLVSLLESLREEGKRTLVFSQSRKMLDIIDRVLSNRKFSVLRVDGTVTQLVERERRIKLFQKDARYSVFLLTTQVGGVGITLTAANRVVIFDPSWNPATDAQAVDRAYRIGQTNDVIIYRLITCGTVEEKIYRRQVFKDSLIRQTTGDKKNPFRYFTKQELKELFSLENTHSSSTALQLQALHSSICRADPELQRHLSTLMDMNVFGMSRHDLLFSGVEDKDEALHGEETQYIEQRVQKAQELVQAEAQLHSLMNDKVSQNTEPAWIRLSRQQGKEEPRSPRRAPDPPAVVDLTQSGSDDLELLSAEGAGEEPDVVTIDLSELTSTDKVEMSITEKLGHMVSDTPLSRSHSSVVLTGAEPDLVTVQEEVKCDWPEVAGKSSAFSLSLTDPDPSSPRALTEADSDGNNTGTKSDFTAQVEVKSDWSNTLMEADSDLCDPPAAANSLQGNFNLQLEDSAELISGYEEEEEEQVEQEVELSAGGGDFQLQMDITGERMELSNHDNCAVPIGPKSVLNTPDDNSILQPIRRKKKAQVIYDSEEGEESIEEEVEEEVEKPVLASSPLIGSFKNLGCSTPKSLLNISTTNRRRSMNVSIASRRSLVESLLQDMEEEEESSFTGTGLSQASESNGTAADESVLEEEEPSGETLNSEEGEEEKLEGEYEGQSFISDSTDVELGSSEIMDQCAPPTVPLLKLTPTKTDIKEAKETFDSLVHSGRCSLAEGRKQEALDLFLRAMDINAGDAEIQLLIIQLYRTLSQPRP